jgi:hypothetical protein
MYRTVDTAPPLFCTDGELKVFSLFALFSLASRHGTFYRTNRKQVFALVYRPTILKLRTRSVTRSNARWVLDKAMAKPLR